MLTLDLQARADAATARAGARAQDDPVQPPSCHADGLPSGGNSPPASDAQRQRPWKNDGANVRQACKWEHDSFVEVMVTADGVCNAVLFWFEADLGGGHSVSSWHGGCGDHSPNRQPSDRAAAGRLASDDDGRRCGAGDVSGERRPDAVAGGPTPGGPDGAAVASSWSQGLQYLDGVRAQRVRAEPLLVRSKSSVRRDLQCHVSRRGCQARQALPVYMASHRGGASSCASVRTRRSCTSRLTRPSGGRATPTCPAGTSTWCGRRSLTVPACQTKPMSHARLCLIETAHRQDH